MRQAFSINDHISTPQTKPVKSLVRCNCIKSSIIVSMIYAIPTATIVKPSFSMVCHATELSKYHARPARRASWCEAITPVTKSKRMNPATHHTSGITGANNATSAAAQPLKYLHKASIAAAVVKDVFRRGVVGILVSVLLQMCRQALECRAGTNLQGSLQLLT